MKSFSNFHSESVSDEKIEMYTSFEYFVISFDFVYNIDYIVNILVDVVDVSVGFVHVRIDVVHKRVPQKIFQKVYGSVEYIISQKCGEQRYVVLLNICIIVLKITLI